MRCNLRDLGVIPFISVAVVFIWIRTFTNFDPPLRALPSVLQTRMGRSINSHTTVAMSTTIKRPDAILQTWLDYNLQRFDLIIIFMDDPTQRRGFERFAQGLPVVLMNGSTGHTEEPIPSRIMLRQSANTETAIAYSLANNITWLIHLDSDELFYEDGDWNWDILEDDVGHIRFVNHEAIPLDHCTVNFFVECTLFKINKSATGFMAYANGKSAVRVTPGVIPWGPHRFNEYRGTSLNVTRPMILHYPYPSFEGWFAKYKALGRFSDFWYDDPDNPIDMKFMLDSRDVVQAALASGNTDKAREFFNAQIPDIETRDQWLAEGSARRICPLRIPKA
jgi:hypothetical protein